MSTLFSDDQQQRIWNAQDFWLATVKAEPAAHLVPIWAVLVEDRFYMATETDSQKVENLRAYGQAALSLPDTREVLIVEGAARLIAPGDEPEAVRDRFQEKYDWSYPDTVVLIELTPEKVLTWSA
ncbi:MAG: pyridoxamine 5'-phosphate oxidase family protein [Anaerolineales bacterium]|nr:pyridoxamine 5'-phosphate oxidase family protein [Anaerolineales bacterium]MCB9128546.1 pyridoxamine 5'-phosphate oxidase family protein [Ardenticatenales bacterium]